MFSPFPVLPALQARPGRTSSSSRAVVWSRVRVMCCPLALDHRFIDVTSRDERSAPDARDVVVLEACSHGPVTLDQLVIATGWSLTDRALALGRLEANGWVMEENGWWEALLLRRGRHAGERNS